MSNEHRHFSDSNFADINEWSSQVMQSFHVIQNIPSPYRLHLFSKMWRVLLENRIEFHVHFMSDMRRGHEERPLSWRNPKIVFPHTYWKDWGFNHYHFNPGLLSFLRKKRPTWVLIGSTFDTFTGFLASQGFNSTIKCAWSEGNTKTPGKMEGIKGWIKRQAFSHCQYIAVPGSDASRYIAMHQERTHKIMPKCLMLPNLIDETRFKGKNKWSEKEILEVRKKLDINLGEKIAITPARLDASKGLIEYLGHLSPDLLKGWRIVILGQGPLKEGLLQVASERKIAEHVNILDYVPYDEMPKFYAAADLFVLPSNRDPNPLSVIEALHSGLPVAVSQMAGNVEEAVTEGRNGWVLPVKHAKLYSQVIHEIFNTDLSRFHRMGQCSLNENAQFWNSDKAIKVFLSGLGVLNGRISSSIERGG